MYLFPLLSLLCAYGMVGCAYLGVLCTDEPMALILWGTLPLTAAAAVLCIANIVCAVWLFFHLRRTARPTNPKLTKGEILL